MRLHFTSGYHPEGDGQTEHANQVLEQYLQGYMNYQQDNWATLLPMAKFAYNNAMNATTGVSPFFANKGYHLEITLDLQAETSSAEAQTFVADLECIQAELKENIAQAQERYQKNVDKHRAEAPELNIGDQAYVSQLATGCVTCHTSHGCVTHFRPILGNLVEVTLVTSPFMYIVSHAKGTSFP